MLLPTHIEVLLLALQSAKLGSISVCIPVMQPVRDQRLLSPDQDRSRYANYSATGNTINANHPIVRRMIMDSLLHYWVEEMHVDGFRLILHRFSRVIRQAM
jgi:hypothetical protein